jgi:hypothetical protein
MAAERTMEDILQDVEKKGWILSNLSCCGAAYEYSCILERGKKDDNGFGVFATSALCATPKEALLAGRQHSLRLQVAVANGISARTGETVEDIL